MSRCHCSAVIRWAGAIVVVSPAFATHTSIGGEVGELAVGDVDLQVAALAQVEREHVEPVRAQPLHDRRADPPRGAGHQRPAPLGQTVPSPAVAPLIIEGGKMTDRWFSEEELAELSRPTMDRAVEAIDAGDLESARRLCGEMKHEWQMLHDLMAAGVLDLVSFIQQRLGEDAVGEAWEQSMNRGWRHHHAAIEALDRRDLVELLAATWRAHSCSGVGPQPGGLRDQRGRREGDLHDEPVRVGPAAGAERRLRRAPRRRRAPARPTTGPSTAASSRSTAPTAAS